MLKGDGLKMRNLIISLFLGLSLNLFSSVVNALDVITHSSVKDEVLTKSKLRRIFIMRQTKWADGTPIRVFVLEQRSELHQSFCKSSLGLFPYQLERQWNKLVYSGLGEAPTVVRDREAMLKRVASTPGSIGYIDDFTGADNIKVMMLEGGNSDD